MTWTDPSTFLNDIDNPVRSVDAKADAANIEAAFTGDPGAPKLKLAALDPEVKILGTPTAGTAYLQKNLGDVYLNTTGVVEYTDRGNQASPPALDATSTFTILVSGTVTATFTSTSSVTGTTTEHRAYKMPFTSAGSVVQNTFPSTVTLDIPVTKGDVLRFDSNCTALTSVTQVTLTLTTGNDVVCVA